MNRDAVFNMLQMQHRMNNRVHADWISQRFEWYRAVWIECAELMDHVGYKWWKKQTPEWEQVRLEVVDIWHFPMSALFQPQQDLSELADLIVSEVTAAGVGDADIRSATEALARSALETQSFSVRHFVALMQACDLSSAELYRHYVGKNVLNFFRQDHGYQEGTYIKQWQDREDNEHLSEILALLDADDPQFPDAVYDALTQRYPGQ
jgi:dimeric dUTPase (all-alpha-NTP-PPase superfamily)